MCVAAVNGKTSMCNSIKQPFNLWHSECAALISSSPASCTLKVNFINCCLISGGGRQSKALNLISNTRCFGNLIFPFRSLTAIRIDAPRCASAFRSHNWVTQQMEMETELEAEAQQLRQRAAQMPWAMRVPAPAPVASALPPYKEEE